MASGTSQVSLTSKLPRSSPIMHNDRDKPTYWELKPVKTSIRKSVCVLHGDGGVKLGSFSSSPHAALAKVIEGAGYSLLVICATLFLGTLVAKGLVTKYKKTNDDNHDKMAKNVSSAASNLIDTIRDSKWALSTTLAGTFVGAVTIFMSQGLRRSFTYTGTDNEKMKALPLAGYGGRVYKIISSDKALPGYYAYPNQRTGNWELFGKPENTVTTTPGSAVETERRFMSSDPSLSKKVNIATDALQQKADALFGDQAPLFSVTTVLGEGRRAPKGAAKRKDGSAGVSADMNVTLPGAGTHRIPIRMAGFGRNIKMPVPRARQHERLYKVRAMLCYMARTCSTLSIDIFALFVFGSMVPYLAYRAVGGVKKKLQQIGESMEELRKTEQRLSSDVVKVVKEASADWEDVWIGECSKTSPVIPSFMEHRVRGVPLPVRNMKVRRSLEFFIQLNDDKMEKYISIEIEQFGKYEKLPEYVEYLAFLEDLRLFVENQLSRDVVNAAGDDDNMSIDEDKKKLLELERDTPKDTAWKWIKIWEKWCKRNSKKMKKFIEENNFYFDLRLHMLAKETFVPLKRFMECTDTNLENVLKKAQDETPQIIHYKNFLKTLNNFLFFQRQEKVARSNVTYEEILDTEYPSKIQASDLEADDRSDYENREIQCKKWAEKWSSKFMSKYEIMRGYSDKNPLDGFDCADIDERKSELKYLLYQPSEKLEDSVNVLIRRDEQNHGNYTTFIRSLKSFLDKRHASDLRENEDEERASVDNVYYDRILSELKETKKKGKSDVDIFRATQRWKDIWEELCKKSSSKLEAFIKESFWYSKVVFRKFETEDMPSLTVIMRLNNSKLGNFVKEEKLKTIYSKYYNGFLRALDDFLFFRNDEEQARKNETYKQSLDELDNLYTLINDRGQISFAEREYACEEWSKCWTRKCKENSKKMEDYLNTSPSISWDYLQIEERQNELKGFVYHTDEDLHEYVVELNSRNVKKYDRFSSFIYDLSRIL